MDFIRWGGTSGHAGWRGFISNSIIRKTSLIQGHANEFSTLVTLQRIKTIGRTQNTVPPWLRQITGYLFGRIPGGSPSKDIHPKILQASKTTRPSNTVMTTRAGQCSVSGQLRMFGSHTEPAVPRNRAHVS